MSKLRILTVGDELGEEELLVGHGHAVAGIAQSAAEALALLSTNIVDLVLLDPRMAGDREGVAFTRELERRGIPWLGLAQARRARSQPVESRLVRARELEIAGRVAASVAHDLNNLLSVVSMSTYMLQQSQAGQLPGLLDELDNAIARATTLTTRLLALIRRGRGEPRELVVNDALRDLARLARRSLDGRLDIVLDLDARVESIRIDPTQFDRLILNLVVEAEPAVGEGGCLTLRSRFAIHAGEPVVIIEVEDSSLGSDEARRDPGTTGLGLPILNDIVEQLGAVLELESAPGRGPRFRITIGPDGAAVRDRLEPRSLHQPGSVG